MGLAEPPGRAAGGTAPLIVVGLDDSQASGRRLRDPCAVETERPRPPAPVFVVPPASQPARYAAGDAGRRTPSESAAQWKRDLPSTPNRMIWAVSAAPTVNDRPAPIRQGGAGPGAESHSVTSAGQRHRASSRRSARHAPVRSAWSGVHIFADLDRSLNSRIAGDLTRLLPVSGSSALWFWI